MAAGIVSNENRQYWLASSTSLALFHYLIELRSTQSYPLPMAMGVVVADRDEFCQVGSGGGNISSHQCYLSRIRGLVDGGFVRARQQYCPQCLQELPGQRQAKTSLCPHCNQRVEPLDVLELEPDVALMGQIARSSLLPRSVASLPGLPAVGHPFLPSPSAATVPAAPSIVAPHFLDDPPGFVCDPALRQPIIPEFEGPRAVTCESDVPRGWSLHPNGWCIDPLGGPRAPWDIRREMPESYHEAIVKLPATPETMARMGLVSNNRLSGLDENYRQRAQWIVASTGLGEPPAPHEASCPAPSSDRREAAGPDRLSSNARFMGTTPEDIARLAPLIGTVPKNSIDRGQLADGCDTIARAMASGAYWSGLRTRCDVEPALVDAAVYGPCPTRKFTDDEHGFMLAHGISTAFARVALAVRDMPLDELVGAPAELRMAEFLNPHDQTEMWTTFGNALDYADATIEQRVLCYADNRFGDYCNPVMSVARGYSDILSHISMLTDAIARIDDAPEYLGDMQRSPADRAVFIDVMKHLMARPDHGPGRRGYCIAVMGCLSFGVAFTIHDIIQWASGGEMLIPSGSTDLGGLVRRMTPSW